MINITNPKLRCYFFYIIHSPTIRNRNANSKIIVKQ